MDDFPLYPPMPPPLQTANIGVPTSQSCNSERTLSGAVWKMSRIFREISCGHFPWKLKDEYLQKVSPNFRCTFHSSLTRTSLWGKTGLTNITFVVVSPSLNGSATLFECFSWSRKTEVASHMQQCHTRSQNIFSAWEFRFLPSFPSFPRENRSSENYVAPIGAFFCTSVSPINGHKRLLTAINGY